MNINNNNADDKFHFVELFLVAADIERTYVATRLRKKDDQGQEFVFAAVQISDGEVVSAAMNEELVEKYLDDMCKMKLDYGLHETEAVSRVISHGDCFYN